MHAKANISLARVGLVSLISILTFGCAGSSTTVGVNNFTRANLVGDIGGLGLNIDTHLINGWGMSYSPTGPFWISDNGTGFTTLYDGSGTIQALVVSVPGAGVTLNGPVTGQVYNDTSDFVITGQGAAKFIFVTEDGTVSAWASGTTAIVQNDRSSQNAIYKGVAIAASGTSNFIYAANFHSGMIDVFTSTYTYSTSFTDASIPAGYAPFNIQAIDGLLYVAYAKQDGSQEDEVAGAGFGYIDVFNPNGTVQTRLVSNGRLNAPWGMAKAPASFGFASNALLVGNFGDGKINAYNISTGAYLGTLRNSAGSDIVIDGLWGLMFGNGASAGSTNTLFFTAGPSSETHGQFGSISVTP